MAGSQDSLVLKRDNSRLGGCLTLFAEYSVSKASYYIENKNK